MKTLRRFGCCLALLALAAASGCDSNNQGAGGGGSAPVATDGTNPAPAAGTPKANPEAAKKVPYVAFVTNGVASFWTIAEKGARDAARDYNCQLEVIMPTGGAADQKQKVEELLSKNIEGIAISPIDPDNQNDLLNEAAAKCKLITQDADAPDSKRLVYIGMDNYDAGRMCGQLVKKALPKGGSVMLFVGRLEQLNAKQRRQGLIDELLDRSKDPTRYDAPGSEIKGDKYTILDTRTDNFDFAAAKAQPEDALSRFPDLGCMVGLFAYNPPYIIEALRGADKLGKVQVVGFDEDDQTLQAIKDGHCYGTIVQNPYRYGYDSIRVLAGMIRGTGALAPPGGKSYVEAREVKKDNVDEFWTELKKLTAETPADKKPADGDKPAADAKPADGDKPATKDGAAASGAAKKAPAKVDGPKVKVAFVTNNASDFWKIAEAGVRKAEAEFNAECEVHLPANGTADDQQQIIEALVAKKIQGIAISPNDPENQVDIINRAAESTNVITHDSDAAKSNRKAYVGTNNFKAGRAAGLLVKEALPNGGKIMMFVGRNDAQNAADRANGIKEELKGTKIEVIDIRTDQTDRARAKQNVEDTLNQYPDVGCLVGLWSYNGPAILEAVRDANKLGKVAIVAFDEEDATLQGVQDGHIHATVVQQPYQFGYESVRVLAALARGQDPQVPADKLIDVPVQVVRREGVQAFWANLKQLRGDK